METMPFILALIALTGTIVTTVQVLLTRRFLRKVSRLAGRPSGGRPVSVSILKPLCGLDDELEENLVSFTKLQGVDCEVILSIEDPLDPAIEVVRRVMAAHPDAPFRVVIEPGTPCGVVNRKVERLLAAERHAKGDYLLISDSNVRTAPEDVAAIVAEFSNPDVGCVSSVFCGSGAQDAGATIESLHLLAFVATGSVLAASVGVPCVVGKSMAISRRALRAIGGFEPFRSLLAEDQAIGLAVKAAGFSVVLSPVTVRNVIMRRTVAKALDRQVRWNKIRFAFSRCLYSAEVLLNPLPWAIAASWLAPLPFVAFPALVLLSRLTQLALLNRVVRAGLRPWQLLLTPLLDILMLYAWCIPFFSNRIVWRGFEARIGRNTELVRRAL